MSPELRAERAQRGLPPYRHEGAPRHPATEPCETDGCPLPRLDYGPRCWRCCLERDRAVKRAGNRRRYRANLEREQARKRERYTQNQAREQQRKREGYRRRSA
jgi:hypothetical protein